MWRLTVQEQMLVLAIVAIFIVGAIVKAFRDSRIETTSTLTLTKIND